jgi:hypothetical protein
MNKEFIPYEQALELKELGFDESCIATYRHDGDFNIVEQNGLFWEVKTNPNTHCAAPLYQQAFRWFREKYKFTYSIGKTNIAVIHYDMTTQLLQDNDSYEAAELAAIKWFIGVAKQK